MAIRKRWTDAPVSTQQSATQEDAHTSIHTVQKQNTADLKKKKNGFSKVF